MKAKRIIFLLTFSLTLLCQSASAQKSLTEQDFVNFLGELLMQPSVDSCKTEVDYLTDNLRNDSRLLDNVLDWAAKYLLDERSPIFNPQFYDSLFIMDRVGQKVLDFNYEDTTGLKHSLYSSTTPDSIVLFFYSADCDHCMGLLREWHSAPDSVPPFLRNRSVLAVCLAPDRKLWRESISLLPSGWILAYDLDGLIVRRRYDLRHLPHIVSIANYVVQ